MRGPDDDQATRPRPAGGGDDADEFGAFASSAYRRLQHAADLLTGDRARAEDLVQHALVRAYLRWPSIREGNPEAYTRRIIVNAYLDWWRRVRWRELPERETDHGGVLPDPAADVVRRDAVQRALARLTRRERAFVVLRFWYDLGEAQIAAELGVARGTVKSTLSRAMAELRDDPELSSSTLDPEGSVLP
jgi:RNA polymerase sigma-70 factor (sigma-E family)